MCQILKISRSAYYHWLNQKPSERLIRRLELGVAIKKVYDWSKSRYGSPRIAKELQMQGISVSRPLVSRIMKKKNLDLQHFLGQKKRIVIKLLFCI